MENGNYNCTQWLDKKKALLWRIPQYIKDAEKCGHPLCAEMWKKIRTDEEKHAEMLKTAIEGLCKEGKDTSCTEGLRLLRHIGFRSR